ncbi:winged helix-turn-helix transcriptional regulator [Limnothrix redekei]|uniref:Helix-turn-helix domain-containing protein n=1 Tax=Limnothrix redekei LRLZ20PSL1 TaxID=3112953 RepID=A0ABW7CA74_9CYAN
MPRPSKEVKRCPVSLLMDILSGPWTLYLLWVLAMEGPIRFGALKRQVEGISTKVLTERLRLLEREGLIYRHYEATVPPQVSYGLTDRGSELVQVLDLLGDLAQHWYGDSAIAPLNPDSETGAIVVDYP